MSHSVYALCFFPQALNRVSGLSSFDSGPAITSSSFFHTFDSLGTYYVTSEGCNLHACRIDVLDEGMTLSRCVGEHGRKYRALFEARENNLPFVYVCEE